MADRLYERICRTTIEIEATDGGMWRATQHGVDVSALGDTPQLAVANFGEIMHDMVHGSEEAIPTDD